MEVSYLILAPYAELHEDGKLFIVSGDLDTIQVPSNFPATAGVPLYLIGKVTFAPAECGRDYNSRIELISPDGTVIEGNDTVIHPPAAGAGRQSKGGFRLIYPRLTFPVPGEYAIRLLIDGTEVRRMPLYVEQVSATQ